MENNDEDVRPFWQHKTLQQMTHEEWESLCDGCGRCCVLTLEEEDTGLVLETNVACNLFDCQTRQCRNYAKRRELVPRCWQLTPQNIAHLPWMPHSCAYRALSEGRGLPAWHPLVTGRRDSVVEAGVAVTGALVQECDVDPDDLESYATHIRTLGHDCD